MNRKHGFAEKFKEEIWDQKRNKKKTCWKVNWQSSGNKQKIKNKAIIEMKVNSEATENR